jgi:protoporphyrinogen oxidase
MQQSPLQMAAQLVPNTIQLNTEVLKINGNQVVLANGQSLTADKIVLATDGFEADKLLGLTPNRPYNMTTCTYFSADRSPLTKKMLVLNPNRASSVHNICVPSDIAPQYAPDGKSLISVSTQGLTTIDEKIVTENIKQELTQWFGQEVVTWQHLKTYKIPRALATFNDSTSTFSPLKLSETLYQCGDCTAYPSLNAAMMSGRKVAELC